MDPNIQAVCGAITALCNAYIAATEGMTDTQKSEAWRWFFEDLKTIRKLLGLPV